MKELAKLSKYTVHAFVLITPKNADSAGNLMKRLRQWYVQYINRTYKSSGTLWEGRFRSCIIQAQGYLFSCQRYIEMNPVRAGIVQHPGEYRWSSYSFNGQGEKSSLIKPHILYKKLGQTNKEKQQAYRDLFRYELNPGDIDKIQKATNGNFADDNQPI